MKTRADAEALALLDCRFSLLRIITVYRKYARARVSSPRLLTITRTRLSTPRHVPGMLCKLMRAARVFVLLQDYFIKKLKPDRKQTNFLCLIKAALFTAFLLYLLFFKSRTFMLGVCDATPRLYTCESFASYYAASRRLSPLLHLGFQSLIICRSLWSRVVCATTWNAIELHGSVIINRQIRVSHNQGLCMYRYARAYRSVIGRVRVLFF